MTNHHPDSPILRLVIYVLLRQFLRKQAPVGGALQKYVTASLHASILYFSHYPTLAAHPRERRVYDRVKPLFLAAYSQ